MVIITIYYIKNEEEEDRVTPWHSLSALVTLPLPPSPLLLSLRKSQANVLVRMSGEGFEGLPPKGKASAFCRASALS